MHPAEQGGADQHAGQNLAGHCGLPQPLEQLGKELGRGEHHEQGEQQLGTVLGGGGGIGHCDGPVMTAGDDSGIGRVLRTPP